MEIDFKEISQELRQQLLDGMQAFHLSKLLDAAGQPADELDSKRMEVVCVLPSPG